MKKTFLISFIAFDWLALDLLTKYWAVLNSGKQLPIIGDFLFLDFYHKNPGVAFGFPLPTWLQIVLTLIVLTWLIVWAKEGLFKNPRYPFLKSFLFAMILGGALGNLFERLIQGYVVDFIRLSFIPTFNIADVGIVIGILGLALFSWGEQKN